MNLEGLFQLWILMRLWIWLSKVYLLCDGAGLRKQDILNILNIDAFAVPSPFNVTWFYSANSFLQQTSALLWGSYGSYKTQRQPSPLVITKTRFFLVHRHTESNTHKKKAQREISWDKAARMFTEIHNFTVFIIFFRKWKFRSTQVFPSGGKSCSIWNTPLSAMVPKPLSKFS